MPAKAPLDCDALDAYEHIAPFYDLFTAAYDHDLWIGNLLGALAPWTPSDRRLLDVACGTGKSFLPMLDRGWEVVGVDLSPAMVTRAAAKARARAELHVADMRELPVLGCFDLVWCLDDAVNYLPGELDLTRALRAMGRNLAPGGRLVFDTNTLWTYRSFFRETETRIVDGIEMTWRGHCTEPAEPGLCAQAEFAATGPAGESLGACVHRQRHFPAPVVSRALGRAGLRLLAVYGHDFSAVLEQPLDEARHTKAVYVAGNE